MNTHQRALWILAITEPCITDALSARTTPCSSTAAEQAHEALIVAIAAAVDVSSEIPVNRRHSLKRYAQRVLSSELSRRIAWDRYGLMLAVAGDPLAVRAEPIDYAVCDALELAILSEPARLDDLLG